MKWNEKENKALLDAVLFCKEQRLPIISGLKSHAKKYMRTLSSVKKHYYTLCPRGNGESLKQALLDVIDNEKVVNINSYQKATLTEKDLELLFRGLVRLIKKQCQSDYKGT